MSPRIFTQFAENVAKNKKKRPASGSSAGKNVNNERSQWRRARLVKADRKVTVTQISTHYNSGMQESISEQTTCQEVDRLQQQKKGKSDKYPMKLSLSVCGL